jgi:tetratricopeptide (TPR) repeat protein
MCHPNGIAPSRGMQRPTYLAGAVAAAGICLLITAGCATLPPNERQQLIDASRQYATGQTTPAMRTTDRLIRDYGRTAEIGEAYYIRGLCRFKAQQRQAAAADFEKAIDKSKRPELIARSRASLAAVAFENGDWSRAAELYGQSVEMLPDVPPNDAVLFSAGLAMQRAGDWREARFQFARILNRFRSRPLAAEARRMAFWRHDYFSIQFGAYRDSLNAGKAVQSARQQGFEASQEYMLRNGQPVYLVIAGRYTTYNEARSALTQVRRRQPQATIVP